MRKGGVGDQEHQERAMSVLCVIDLDARNLLCGSYLEPTKSILYLCMKWLSDFGVRCICGRHCAVDFRGNATRLFGQRRIDMR